MKKVIGILYDYNVKEEDFYNGCGGTETWVIQISKEFARRNYHVIVFSHCDIWFLYNSGVEYMPIEYFSERVKYQYFDYFIFVRSLDNYYDILVNNNNCNNIYLQSHDMFIWENGLYQDKFIYGDKYKKIKKFIALTNFHKEELYKYNNIPYEKIEVIGNGLDSDVFNEIDQRNIEKDNSILFSTSFGRGGIILVNDIMPLVRKVITDFTVHICGYEDTVPEEVKNNPNVKFLGMLNKEEYYREFMKHKCWFLPCVVVEDFGICAGEAAMCECDIISPFKHGMKDVCWGFESLKMRNEFSIVETDNYHYSTFELNMTDEDYYQTCEEAASKIIVSIMNYGHPERKMIRRICKEFIMKEHTWKKVVDKWINIFEYNK